MSQLVRARTAREGRNAPSGSVGSATTGSSGTGWPRERIGYPRVEVEEAVIGFSRSEKDANPFRVAGTRSTRDGYPVVIAPVPAGGRLRRTASGQSVSASSAEHSALLMGLLTGLPVARAEVLVHVMSGVPAGFAGAMTAACLQSAVVVPRRSLSKAPDRWSPPLTWSCR